MNNVDEKWLRIQLAKLTKYFWHVKQAKLFKNYELAWNPNS
jgi:hypothetical protein